MARVLEEDGGAGVTSLDMCRVDASALGLARASRLGYSLLTGACVGINLKRRRQNVPAGDDIGDTREARLGIEAAVNASTLERNRAAARGSRIVQPRTNLMPCLPFFLDSRVMTIAE